MERRKHKRMESLNLISFTGVGKEDKEVVRGMGRTLNLGESGILLETHVPLASHSSILLEIGLKEDILAIKGTVVYCSETPDKIFQTGIDFVNINHKDALVMKEYVAAFRGKKHPQK